jgi:chitin synthase
MYIIRWQALLLVAMLVPYILTFLHSILLSVFFIHDSPPFLLTLWVIFFIDSLNHFLYFRWAQVHVVEACHTAGLALLVFRILPALDNVTSLFLLNGVCLVPAILNIFSSHRGLNGAMKPVVWLGDILAAVMQLSIFFLPFMFETQSTMSPALRWQIPLALVLISLGYWESFTEMRPSQQPFFQWFHRGVKMMEKTRPKIYITASLVKMTVLIFTAIHFLPESIDRQLYRNLFKFTPIGSSSGSESSWIGSEHFESNQDLFRVTMKVYIPFIVQIVSSCICYYTGRVACKVKKRNVSMSTLLFDDFR